MKLAVIMPIYNEHIIIKQVIIEWINELDKYNLDYTIFTIDDGSTDTTYLELQLLVEKYQQKIKTYKKENSGHGQTCIWGYKKAIELGYDWIFQIDSDGQCDPKYFSKFLEAATQNICIYGFRNKRDDGFQRYIISRFVSIFVFLATYIWVRDANVPYRLMHRKTLNDILNKIPLDFYLANILIAALQVKNSKIKWINIGFRERAGGVPSVKAFSFLKHGIKLYKQLKNITI